MSWLRLRIPLRFQAMWALLLNRPVLWRVERSDGYGFDISGSHAVIAHCSVIGMRAAVRVPASKEV